MNFTALIVAAGSGKRMGLDYNKMFYKLKNNKTVLEESITLFKNHHGCKQIVVVLNRDDLDDVTKKCCAGDIVFVSGGDTRQESVANGLMAVKEDIVFIHDGARPWVEGKYIDEMLTTLKQEQACLLMVPAKDTIKEVVGGYVKQTFDRTRLWLAQTPQAFHTRLMIECHKKARELNLFATDDAQLLELCSDIKIKVVEGSYKNIKITTMEDVISQ